MQFTERTRDIYENIPGYIQPPLNDFRKDIPFYQDHPLGLDLYPFVKRIARAILSVAGYFKFINRLPDQAEQLLRTTNLRGPALFGPVISATVALQNDAQNPSALQRAVQLVIGSYMLHTDIRAGNLLADRAGENYLEMGQYPNLFATSIIIEDKTTRIFKSACQNQFTVLCKGQFFLVEIDDWDDPLLAGRLYATLQEIVSRSEVPVCKYNPGAISAASDRTQHRIFKILKSKQTNRFPLERLRHSLFTLCLDLEEQPTSYASALQLAHSGNDANRWFHSGLQLVVFGNAYAAAICNFSVYLDGNTMMRGCAELLERAAASTRPELPEAHIKSFRIRPLKWDIPPAFVEKAQQELSRIKSIDPATYDLPDLGKQTFKDLGIKAVPAFVVALQATLIQLTGSNRRIHQFICLTHFRYMDLTTTQISLPSVTACARMLLRNEVNAQEFTKLLKRSIEAQNKQITMSRQRFPVEDTIALFLKTRTGIGGRYSRILVALLVFLLKVSGQIKQLRREVIISHPKIYPQLPYIGRPGVRLPYITYFGMHYQILDDQTRITIMPGQRWTTANSILANTLQNNLKRIIDLVGSAKEEQVGQKSEQEIAG